VSATTSVSDNALAELAKASLVADGGNREDDSGHPLAQAFRDFVQDPHFPCVGAKSALSHDEIRIVVARDIRSGWDDLRIYPALLDFVSRYQRDPGLFRSFTVLFEAPKTLSEAEFEDHLWARLQSLSDKDAWLGLPYDERVKADPEDKSFSLSFGGEAFFVVGLHPNSSRKARRFETPALVFNLHDQFEQLRADGKYEKLRQRIVDRDLRYSGSINPMLATYGEGSEARQYSGRAVEEEWVCPLRPRKDPSRAP
jgi:FPC/CPF motif-containing protein YcgG